MATRSSTTSTTTTTTTTPAATTDGTLGVNDLRTLLREWMRLEDIVTQKRAELRQATAHAAAVSKTVKRIMADNNLAEVATARGNLLRTETPVPARFSKSFVGSKVTEFFGPGEAARAAALLQYLEQQQAASATTREKLEFADVEDGATGAAAAAAAVAATLSG